MTLHELGRNQTLSIARDYVSRAYVGGEGWADLMSDAEVLDAARLLLRDVAGCIVDRDRCALSRICMMRDEAGAQRLMFEFSDGSAYITPAEGDTK
ncbi:hypothetical protein [Paraburkholderia sp. BR14320]|uniref:hypothetical protein n=1 Tax=unclassified Paraburkholderia TaxID=2615204 RepID=UPI0034CD8D81